ncbi:MAG: Hpt domain-containing protein [Oscillibacter sp.]|nr:Hpt domain-containing protein [Oscillibacter sp.]
MNREHLIAAGVDYDEGLHRFMGKTEKYEKYLRMIFQESSMDDLLRFLQEKNYSEAFRAAHTLKGNSGNLSMNRFYHTINPLVETLRGSDGPNAPVSSEDPMPLYEKVKEAYEQARRAVEE